jgi:hypothetical protein
MLTLSLNALNRPSFVGLGSIVNVSTVRAAK